MRRVSALLLVLAGVALGACSRSTGESLTAQAPDPALSGRFFAAAGENSSLTDLYEARFVAGRLLLYRLTETQRVGGIGACPSTLIVTNADRSVGFTDTLQQFGDGAFSVIDGLADPKASSPAVTPDCRLLFARFDRSTDPPTDHLWAFDPVQRKEQELHTPGEGKILGIADWGPGGRVAVFEGTAAEENKPTVATGIVIIGADGSKRTLPSPVTEFGTLQWGASKWIAVADEVNGKTVFLDPDSGGRTELAGWFPLAWSPDGQRLMVTDAAERKTLGLVDAADLTAAREVGSAEKAAFFDLLWLPWDAAAGGPIPALGRRPDDGN